MQSGFVWSLIFEVLEGLEIAIDPVEYKIYILWSYIITTWTILRIWQNLMTTNLVNKYLNKSLQFQEVPHRRHHRPRRWSSKCVFRPFDWPFLSLRFPQILRIPTLSFSPPRSSAFPRSVSAASTLSQSDWSSESIRANRRNLMNLAEFRRRDKTIPDQWSAKIINYCWIYETHWAIDVREKGTIWANLRKNQNEQHATWF